MVRLVISEMLFQIDQVDPLHRWLAEAGDLETPVELDE
jgi:hypothetical protein